MDSPSPFLEHYALIKRLLAAAARRHGLYDDDAAEFASWAHARLIADDYAVFRKFKGHSSISTYLTVVVANLARDYHVHRWGRWRPSVEAKRLGEVAVKLEKLMYRDGHNVPQAVSILRSHDNPPQSDSELARLAARLPVRPRAREVRETTLADLPADVQTDEAVIMGETAEAWAKTRLALEIAMASLQAEDQLILRLYFWEGTSVADIARTLGLQQKPLYRRIDRQLKLLRTALEAGGVSSTSIANLLSQDIVA